MATKRSTYEGTPATPWEHVAEIVNEHVAAGHWSSCPSSPTSKQLPFYQALDPQEQQGVKVILQRGCGSCHTIPNIPGAAGTIGPNLAGDRPEERKIAGGAVPNNSPADLAEWILDPPSLKPGTAMPKLGLAPDEAARSSRSWKRFRRSDPRASAYARRARRARASRRS